MRTIEEVMADLRSRASEKTRLTYLRHGSPADRTLGVSNADQKAIAKTIRKQQALACELYATGILEAMYLAGLVADGAKLTREQLESWAEGAANMTMVSEHPVPWVAVESADPRRVALDWIASPLEHVACAGWRTYAGFATVTPDAELDLKDIEALLESIPKQMAQAQNRVRYNMNGFVISIGTYVQPLLGRATAVAEKLGKLSVDVGDTACKVPLATAALARLHQQGHVDAKRKTIRC